jgi:hypothetical protein
MMKANIIKSILITAFLFAATATAECQIEMSFTKSFIDSIKDKISITIDYNLYNANDKNVETCSSMNTGKGQSVRYSKKDKDLILSGGNEYIGLPIVTRIFNAKFDQKAIDLISKNKSKRINITGVWRIWCDYFGNDIFTQGLTNEHATSYNPEHVFEMTPALKINDITLDGYNEEIRVQRITDAETAFEKYSTTKTQINITDSIVTLTIHGVDGGFVDFFIKITGIQEVKNDGRVLLCNVYDKEDKLLYKNLRTIFIKDTEAEKTVRNLRNGERLRVLGIPRISLNEIYDRIKISEIDTNVKSGSLPVEMVIISLLN